MDKWRKIRLGDLISIKGGFSYKGKFIGHGSSILLGMGCVSFSEKFVHSGARMYSGSCPDSHLASPGDLVLATRQQSDNMPILGAPALVPQNYHKKVVIVGTNLYKVINNSEVSNDFLFWLFKSSIYRDYILSCSKGTTVRMITKDAVESFEFNCPPKKERDEIAKVLWQLETKIDLLNCQNATLEKMAETLFRQWFVEPIIDEEFGELGEYADNIKVNIKVEELSNYDHYIGLEHVPKKSITITELGGTTGLESNKYLFEENDILFGKLRSYFHKVVFAPVKGVCSTDILVIRPKKPKWAAFCLFWFSSKDVVEYSDSGSGGTRMPRTSWEILSKYKIPRPGILKIEEFGSVAAPFINKIKINQTQIKTLKTIRDTLLPKLISGEIRVDL